MYVCTIHLYLFVEPQILLSYFAMDLGMKDLCLRHTCFKAC